MPVRILLMDIDDTLFDFQTGYKRAHQMVRPGRRSLRLLSG